MLCAQFGPVFIYFSLSNLFSSKVKIDTDHGIVQNAATIVVTAMLELFVKYFVTKSLKIAKRKGRNTILRQTVNNHLLGVFDLLLP